MKRNDKIFHYRGLN
ncbi:TPA: hypothetical protein ACM4H3_000817 [Escherichia coli]|nr:hypothetical protein [Escherichia coli]